jgi:hypothetical protein
MVNDVHPRAELMDAVLVIAEKITDNYPPPCNPSNEPCRTAKANLWSRRSRS